MPDLNWAASIVLSYGGWAVVMEPPELRKIVREWASSLARLHSTEDEWQRPDPLIGFKKITGVRSYSEWSVAE